MNALLRMTHPAIRLALLAALLFLPLPRSAGATGSDLPANPQASFASMTITSNIETAGIVVSGFNLSKAAQLFYLRDGETIWRNGHSLARIDDGRLAGSLFNLAPSTSYQVRVSDGAAEISGSFITQSADPAFTPQSILYVNANAIPGGDGSAGAPYSTIQEAVNQAGPGTQVLVADGIYKETISFPASGSPNNWIQVKAAGAGAILEGSDTLTGNVWARVEGKNNLWFMRLDDAIRYLARDGLRFYQYDDMRGLNNMAGHGNVTIREGWFYDQSAKRLYIRSQDDPNAHAWQIPRFNQAFNITARDWIWIEGFEMRFSGRCGVCALNASHLTLRRNRIHNVHLGIFIQWDGDETQGNDTRIEFNEVYDPPVANWDWNALKGGAMESTGIIVRGHIGAIVRGNEVHHYFNGIYTGVSGAAGENPAIAFDADIYDNRIHHISDDALEPEGACINHRFRNNAIDAAFSGVSLAPITYGPTWAIRNTVANFTNKAVKWSGNSDGIVYFYHNTSWTNAPDANGMDLITPIKNTVLRNNIFQINGNGFSFIARAAGASANDWNFDNWFNSRTSSNPHFKWEKVNYSRINDLCKATGLECRGSDSAPGLVDPASGNFALLANSPNVDRGALISGINDSFSGAAPDIGAFELQTFSPPTQTPVESPTATQIPATDTPTIPPPTLTPFPSVTELPIEITPSLTPFPLNTPPAVLSIARLDASPSNAVIVRFRVTFSEEVSGVNLSTSNADFVLTSTGINGASIVGIGIESNASYIVQVNTGEGNGTLQLHLLDNDNIRDLIGQPLGGMGSGNGNFLGGEIYEISKPAPATVITLFRSVGANDGWILEAQKNTGFGGTYNASESTFLVGDDNRDRQYVSILQFQTASLPDNATITKAILMIRSQSYTNVNSFTVLGNIIVDIQKGYFGSSGVFGLNSLNRADFQAPASMNAAGAIPNNPIADWYWTTLDAAALQYINLNGVTEFRLRFQRPTNDNRHNDFIRFYSGNYSSSVSHPILQIEYHAP